MARKKPNSPVPFIARYGVPVDAPGKPVPFTKIYADGTIGSIGGETKRDT